MGMRWGCNVREILLLLLTSCQKEWDCGGAEGNFWETEHGTGVEYWEQN